VSLSVVSEVGDDGDDDVTGGRCLVVAEDFVADFAVDAGDGDALFGGYILDLLCVNG
jgi:hypothetical protein